MGNEISSTRKHFTSRHVDDETTITSKNEKTENLKISDAVAILIDTLCAKSQDSSSFEETPHTYYETDFHSHRPKSSAKDDLPNRTTISALESVSALSSATIKSCFFSKKIIGPTTPHYSSMSLTDQPFYMLPAAMDLKGCPTISDEDLRTLENKFPNLFRKLPDELQLSSAWTRTSKVCSFSGKPIPDGYPFFHSKNARKYGTYYLLASAIGMKNPSDVEPLTRDLLILLQTDYPDACDHTPSPLIQDPNQWELMDKFCFFSKAPIHTHNEVHYISKAHGKTIYMLAFLSPNLTPEELYRIHDPQGHTSVQDVKDVEHIYDLTELDFHELRKFYLGPCRELKENRLVPKAWTKILPQSFIHAREIALRRALQYELNTKATAAAAANVSSSAIAATATSSTITTTHTTSSTSATIPSAAVLFQEEDSNPDPIQKSHLEIKDLNRENTMILDTKTLPTVLTFKDIQEEGAFSKTHPMDEIMDSGKKEEFTGIISQSITSTEDDNLGICLVPGIKSMQIQENSSTMDEELLTTYINASEAVNVDYYDQEFSIGSCVGDSFSYGSPARTTHANDVENHLFVSACNVSINSIVLGNDPSIDEVQTTAMTDPEYVTADEHDKNEKEEQTSKEKSSDDCLENDEHIDGGKVGGCVHEDSTMNITNDRLSQDPAPSSAMRVAHELLRKNRLKRQLQVIKLDESTALPKADDYVTVDRELEQNTLAPDEVLSDYCTDTQSELSRTDKNARRALILQLAKNRINKNQKMPVMVSID